MKTTSTILLTATGLAVLAAVWAPGAWWQWAITALVLLFAGAGTGAAADKRRHPIDGPELLPEHVAEHVAEYKRTYGRKADR